MRHRQFISEVAKDVLIPIKLDDWMTLHGLVEGYDSEFALSWSFIRPGDVVIDVGANIGIWTIGAAKRAGLQGKVHSFEPLGENFVRLFENVELNSVTNVVPQRFALSDRAGPRKFYPSPNNNSGVGRLMTDGWIGPHCTAPGSACTWPTAARSSCGTSAGRASPSTSARVEASAYGSCLGRLPVARLAGDYLPILDVAYRDGAGVRYTQESFVGRLPGRRSLVSFIRVTADARGSTTGAALRLVSSAGRVSGLRVPRGQSAELDASVRPRRGAARKNRGRRLETARATSPGYWQKALAAAPSFVVPDADVMNAERALEIDELAMTWRYSVGNVYEELSYVEALDVAEVMAGYGYFDVARQILRFTLKRLPVRYTNWRAGERLVAGAQYYRLSA